MTGMLSVDPLPRVMHEAGAAVLLVDLATSRVTYANRLATRMAGQQQLPMSVDRWGELAGLTDPAGSDLAATDGTLSRVARGEPVAGELIRRVSHRASSGAADEQRRQDRQPAAAPTPWLDSRPAELWVEDVDGPLWVVGFPLHHAEPAEPGGRAGQLDLDRGDGPEPARDADQALVVFMAVTPAGEPGAAPVAGMDPDSMGARAVIATDLSFAITDPSLPDNPLVWVNPAFSRTTGYGRSEVVGRNCRFLQGPATDPRVVAVMREGIQRREAVTVTLLNYRRDGSAFWNQVSLSPVFDGQGELVNYVGVQVDVTERVEAERDREEARARVEFLARVSAAVSGLDARLAMRELGALVTEQLADGCLVAAVENSAVEVVAAAGEVPVESVGRRRRAPTSASVGTDPVGQLLLGRRQEPLGLDVAAARELTGSVGAWLARLLPGHVSEPVLVLPMRGRGEVLALVVVTGVRVTVDDRMLLGEAVARCALAVENARLFAREHAMAETLQRSLLPGPVAVADLDVWARYAPNTVAAQVGGDWYDVITRPDGGHGLVIGDVVGHDVEAAAVMGQLRSICRAYGYESQDPAAVLDRVDQLAFSMQLPRLATAVYLDLSQGPRGWQLTWANAGHLPPLVARDRQVQALQAGAGTLIGLVAGERHNQRLALSPGDWLVLYTDGLVERRDRPMEEGVRMLQEAMVASAASTARALGEELLAAVGRDPDDDLALVVVRIPQVGGPMAGQVERTFEATRTAPRAARAFATQWLRAAGTASATPALIVVSELVTNAVRHARAPVRVALALQDTRIRVEVGDRSRIPPDPGAARGDVGGRGLGIVSALADWGWRAEEDGKTVWALLHPEPDHHL